MCTRDEGLSSHWLNGLSIDHPSMSFLSESSLSLFLSASLKRKSLFVSSKRK